MNVLLWLCYKGTDYAGFQVQPNGQTVCAVLQDAMQAVLGARPDVKGCSRTDAGVHARRFALNFRYDGAPAPEKLAPALNAHLPADVRVISAQPVPEAFHARYAAHAKTYRYFLLNSRVEDPFTAAFCHRIAGPLDAAAMQAAAEQLTGTHDFSAFCAAGSSAAMHGDTVRTVTACTARRSAQDARYVVITVTADGYLYNMVRILAGTLVEVGRGRLAAANIPAILASRDRGAAGPTLPARGLFLWDVAYAPEDLRI